MSDLIAAHVRESGESLYAVDIEVNGHAMKGDEPETYGSANLGPAPYDLLLAALGECTVMTIRWFALQRKWPLERAEAKLTHEKVGHKDVFTKTITLHGDDLTAEQRQKLIDVAAKCPVHKTLMSEVTIDTRSADSHPAGDNNDA